jgi:Uncharacterised protein family (UPF0183)
MRPFPRAFLDEAKTVFMCLTTFWQCIEPPNSLKLYLRYLPIYAMRYEGGWVVGGKGVAQTELPESSCGEVITADSTWDAVKSLMGEAGRAAIHSQQRIHTFVYGYKGLAFEVLRSGYIASMTLFQP